MLMPKKTQKADIHDAKPMRREPAPPLLSEEGITKLQAAVDAAQRKRLSRRNPPTYPKTKD
jgi:hypothetical protein